MNKFERWARGSALGILVGLLLFAHELATAQPHRLECAGISAASGRWTSTSYTLRGFAGQPHPVRIALNENHILIPGFLACITDLARCTGEAVARVEGPAAPVQGSQINVPLFVNMAGIPAPDQRLGAFSGSLSWNPALLTYVSHTALQSGFTGLVNADNAAAGLLEFNGANPAGVAGDVAILGVTFRIVGAAGANSTLDLSYTDVLAAGTFLNLLPCLTVNDSPFTIDAAPECRVCGDVNDDGTAGSSDALIILTYDAGLSVPFPVGTPGGCAISRNALQAAASKAAATRVSTSAGKNKNRAQQ